ncbi:hypothetical protein ABW19_dt0204499 [Dactylella cylindrospora]|nr:hypothetical protein ABW19_dt0204499 [Dactylella cylindrospora]
MVKPANFSTNQDSQNGAEVTFPPPGVNIKSVDSNDVVGGYQQPSAQQVQIIDIRHSIVEFQLEEAIVKGLDAATGQKTLPTMLLYDEAGLKHFEAITYINEYYLTNSEIEVLTQNAEEIAARVPDGALLVELGSGNLRKVNILLQALEATGKRVDYFALDLSRPELERTFAKLPNGGFQHVRCFGLHGTYDDGRKWLMENKEIRDRPRFVLWLGSSIGNYERAEAAAFLSDWRRDVIRPGSQDRMLVAFDSCHDPEKVYFAYNDPQLVTEKFIMNGLNNANNILGKTVFNFDEWLYHGEYDILNGRHQAFFKAKSKIVLPLQQPVKIEQGECVRIERSYKFSTVEIDTLFEESGLQKGTAWGQTDGDYSGAVPLKPAKYAAAPCPDLAEWEGLWAVWDTVTRKMVRRDQYGSKPIDLRNPIIFYLGHIPNFLDVKICEATGEARTPPESFAGIFQRGIDPDVDDPTLCHSHSEIPTTWPPLNDIIDYQGRVRQRVADLLKRGNENLSVGLRRALWVGYEHEAMHLETLLYMLLQHDLTVPPAGVPIPDFKSEWQLDESMEKDGEVWISIPAQKLLIGFTDRENEGGHFGWDNERPLRDGQVAGFEVFSRPITNKEYATYLRQNGIREIPESWTRNNRNVALDTIVMVDPDVEKSELLNGLFVKTVFGPVPLVYAQNWPVVASYDEINGCAKWMGGRLPSREELQVIYDHVEHLKFDMEGKKLAAMIDAVNG